MKRLFLLLLLSPAILHAEIILPSILSHNMVLQQNATVKLWGWKTVKPNGEIRITNTWNRDTIRVKALRGKWETTILTPNAGGKHALYFVSDFEKVEIENILIGEVWLGSGQSNMEMPVDSIFPDFPGMVNFIEEIASADYPEIRLFHVEKQAADYPQNDLNGEWKVCTPETVKDFSAVAYSFARKVHESLKMPVGMIASSWGGTNAETWISKEVLQKNEKLSAPFKGVTNSQGWYPSYPGRLYNSMIYPLQSFTIKGVIWYQGESNRNRPETYKEVMEVLIGSWREQWGNDFSFYYTQIAPFGYQRGTPGSYLREAQLHSMDIPNTGMVVTNDIGDLKHIHPREKRKVGERLALWALAKDYALAVDCSGPVYKGMRVEKDKVIISFEHANGLKSMEGELTNFEIAGEDQHFIPAKAKIKNDQVIVYSKKIKKPVAVRFAFSDTAQPDLYNEANLPASAFRTDDWPEKK